MSVKKEPYSNLWMISVPSRKKSTCTCTSLYHGLENKRKSD